MTESEHVILSSIGGVFRIDENGCIWRIKTGKRAEHPTGKDDYLQLRLMVSGKRHCVQAHRIVWMNLHGPISDELEINHDNGLKQENRPGNLLPCTGSENAIHARTVLGKGDQRGEKNHRTHLTERMVEVIKSRRRAGESLRSLSIDYGISFQAISKICRGDRWSHIE